jgi:hypothetical protein
MLDIREALAVALVASTNADDDDHCRVLPRSLLVACGAAVVGRPRPEWAGMRRAGGNDHRSRTPASANVCAVDEVVRA